MSKKFNYINFEDARLASFMVADFFKLEKVFSNKVFFFDEIQNVKEWERYIRHLVDNKVKCVITGSNASLLSRELGTKLTGRHLTTELFPFSYTEFLTFLKKKASEKNVKDYLYWGGFPEFLKVKNAEVLQHLLNDIISRDIVVRLGIKDFKTLRELTVFLLSNVGKEFSYNKLTKYFKLGSVNTLISYLSHLEDSYLFFIVPKLDYSFKKQMVNPKKIYCIDTGLARVNSVSFSKDKGRILENAVFLHLRRQFKDIYYFRDDFECDFIVKDTLAVQVCYRIDENNKRRELEGVKEAMKKFKIKIGVIVTFNQTDSVDGIDLIPISHFLSSLQ
jgi:uncharacterized protein